MTDNQSNTLDSFNAIIELTDNNPAIAATVPAFVTIISALRAKRNSIQIIIGPQTTNITGVAQDKNTLRIALCEITFSIISPARAYALSIGNNTLAQSLRKTLSQLKQINDDSIAPICQNYYNTLNPLIVPLAPFGISPTVMTAFQQAINDYSLTPADPILAKQNISVLTSNLKTLFSEARKIVREQIKTIAISFKPNNPDFYKQLLKATQIIDLGSTTTKIRGTVTDEEKNPLAGVLIALRLTGVATRVPAYQTITNAEGKFSITKIKPGNYDIEVSLPGYTTLTETNIRFAPGKELKRKYILTKSL